MAIASLILGIASLPLSFIYAGIVTAVIGLVLGLIARKKQKEAGFSTGMAMAGIISSVITLVLSIVVIGICTWALCAAGSLLNGLDWS